MKKFALSTLICATLAAGAVSAHAGGLGDALRGQLGGGGAAETSSSSGLGGLLGSAGVPLPGGDFPVRGVADQIAALRLAHPFLDEVQARRLVRGYGTDAARMLSGARSWADLGRDFGAGLAEREVRWLMAQEFARTAEDVVWRRSKLGLRMTEAQISALQAFMDSAALKAAE